MRCLHKSLASLVLFQKPARTAKKMCFPHTALDCCHESSPHSARIMTNLGGCTLSVESSLPSLRAVDGLCLEVWPGTWGPDPVLNQFFAMQNRRSFPIRKNHPEMGQAPTSQSRPRDTDHLRPSNGAARTLSLVEHTLSKFGGDLCPVR